MLAPHREQSKAAEEVVFWAIRFIVWYVCSGYCRMGAICALLRASDNLVRATLLALTVTRQRRKVPSQGSLCAGSCKVQMTSCTEGEILEGLTPAIPYRLERRDSYIASLARLCLASTEWLLDRQSRT